jgi:uncharacterized protein
MTYSSRLPFVVTLSFALSALTGCSQQQQFFDNVLPKAATDAPLFDNSIILVEKSGSRALNEGIFYSTTDREKAKALLLEATQEGNDAAIRAVAFREYGKLLFTEKGVYDQKSLAALQQAHHLGDPQATYLIAAYHSANNEEAGAVTLLTPIVSSYTPAKLLLGQLYLKMGKDGMPFIRQAAEDYEQLLRKGDTAAHFSLAEIYAAHDAGLYNPALAIHHYEKAALHGNTNGYWQLAEFYRKGEGVQADPAKAVTYYEKVAATGNARAAHQLAEAYGFKGWYMPDPVKQVQWWKVQESLRTAAGQPVHKLRTRIGTAYATGYGVSSDATQAKQWLDPVVAHDPMQAYVLSRRLRNAGTAISISVADHYLQKALQQGDVRAKKSVQKKTVKLHKQKTKKPKLKVSGGKITSLEEVERAAASLKANPASGDARRYFIVGDSYIGFGKSDEGIAWLNKAAEKGSADAMKRLAKMYAAGVGVPQSFKESLTWQTKAAELGDTEAQYYAGLAYARGLGVDKDAEKAVYWLSKASKGGNAEAKTVLDTLNTGDPL